MSSDGQGSVFCGCACLRTGALTSATSKDQAPQLEDLAAAAQELLGTGDYTLLSELFTRHGSDRSDTQFADVVILSGRGSYVVKRSSDEPERALVAVSTTSGRLGLVLSTVRARLKAPGERA